VPSGEKFVSAPLIGYQIQAHWQNNSTVLITIKGSIIKSVSAFFFDILTGYFLTNLPSLSSKEYAMCIALKIDTGEIL